MHPDCDPDELLRARGCVFDWQALQRRYPLDPELWAAALAVLLRTYAAARRRPRRWAAA
jgi:hypothetical protein